jgi:hypothetical protein
VRAPTTAGAAVACGLAACLLRPAVGQAQRAADETPVRLQPAGVGIVRPVLDPERPLRFYGSPLPAPAGGDAPVDSLVFAVGPHAIEIAYAPPWFDPDHMKLDHDLLMLRAETLTRDRIEVVVNRTEPRPRFTPRTRWVDRAAVEFRAWPDVLLDVYALEPVRSEGASPSLRRGAGEDFAAVEAPLAEAALAGELGPLHPVAVRGDWVQVEAGEAPEPRGPIGWLRWRRDGLLLVTLVLLS